VSLFLTCPRLGITLCSPQDFAAKLNAISSFPDRPGDDGRIEITLLSCMVALGGKARCTVLGHFLVIESDSGCFVVRQRNGIVEIAEFEGEKQNS
jgi:hypothetical protein